MHFFALEGVECALRDFCSRAQKMDPADELILRYWYPDHNSSNDDTRIFEGFTKVKFVFEEKFKYITSSWPVHKVYI